MATQPPLRTMAMGPGTLVLVAKDGSDNTVNISMQATNIVLSPASSIGDRIRVHSGDYIAGAYTEKAVLKGSLVQDFGTGYIDWELIPTGDSISVQDALIQLRGKQADFNYLPDSKGYRSITGICMIMPSDIGGDVRDPGTVDFEFPVSSWATTVHTPTA